MSDVIVPVYNRPRGLLPKRTKLSRKPFLVSSVTFTVVFVCLLGCCLVLSLLHSYVTSLLTITGDIINPSEETGIYRSNVITHNFTLSNSLRIQASDSYSLFFSTREQLRNQQDEGKQELWKSKKILFWNPDYDGGRHHAIGLGQDVFRKANCPIWQCETYDRQMTNLSIPYEEFDALVFFEPNWKYDNRPERRLPQQRYVYWTLESPVWQTHRKEWKMLKGFFNWTMTYRWDSDIVHPYGWFLPTNPAVVPMRPSATQLQELFDKVPKKQFIYNFTKDKKKLIAWFVSNCQSNSGRNEFVTYLKKFVPIDIYGSCGTLNCSRTDAEDCRSMLQRDYKFYLALENSLCLDYVTEKFFTHMQFMIVPIVLDLHGNHKQYAPPHSYINALDFASVKDLADYLILLDNNDMLYRQYFWWKGHYEIHERQHFERGLCHLCTLLHRPQAPKVYQDLDDWWYNQSTCQRVFFDNSTSEQLTVEATIRVGRKNGRKRWLRSRKFKPIPIDPVVSYKWKHEALDITT